MSSSSFLKTCSVALADFVFVETHKIPYMSDTENISFTIFPKTITKYGVHKINDVIKCEKLPSPSEIYSLYRFIDSNGGEQTIALAKGNQTYCMDNEIETKQKDGGFVDDIIMHYTENDAIMNKVSNAVVSDNPQIKSMLIGRRYHHQFS